MILNEEEAKAVTEVAKASGKVLDLVGSIGGFLDRVFGDLITDSVGIYADKLKYYRLENLTSMHAKITQKLIERNIEVTRNVSPKVGIPLLEQVAIEDDENIHELWANMLVNAMDPNYKNIISRKYVSILSDLEAIDVFILDKMVREYKNLNPWLQKQALFSRQMLSKGTGFEIEQCELSLRNLIRLGCVKPGVVNMKTDQTIRASHEISSYKDTELVGLTLLGIKLHDAVN